MLDTDTDARPDLPRRPPKDRKIGRIVLPALILVLVLVAFGLSRFYTYATGASGPRVAVVVEIPQGSTGAAVAGLLQQRNVIRSALGFKILARVKHSQPFVAGRYELTTNMTAAEALAALEAPAKVTTVRVTIPEGLDIQQEAAILASKLQFSAAAFEREATSGAFAIPGYYTSNPPTVEGFLFPDTYFFYPDATPKAVIDEQLAQFQHVSASLGLTAGAQALGVPPLDVVTVASIIEREARFSKDRPRVAEVVYNRLKAGMKLQLDSTVAYAVGKVGQTPSHADYRSTSPYNTYVHAGLPPTPIANPGRAALLAALHPSNAGYLYFILIDKAGHEAFTASYDEFLRLKAQAPR